MRVMVFVKATEDSEQGIMHPEWMSRMLVEMGKYNEELVKAGIMQSGDGLKPSSAGKRVAFDGPNRKVIDGPFAEAHELVAGYWVWEVKDMDEAVAWVKRCPNPMYGPSEIEIRPFYEMADFAEHMTPEAEQIHDGLREKLETVEQPERRRKIMRVMVFAITSKDSPKGLEPTPEMLAAWEAMDKFTEELVTAGVMVAGAGLPKPPAEGKRIVCEGSGHTVIDGPFAETHEIVAGFSIWEVKDMDEAVAWAKRAPNAMPGRSVMEIRPFYEAADLADFVSPEELAAPREGERGRLGVA